MPLIEGLKTEIVVLVVLRVVNVFDNDELT